MPTKPEIEDYRAAITHFYKATDQYPLRLLNDEQRAALIEYDMFLYSNGEHSSTKEMCAIAAFLMWQSSK